MRLPPERRIELCSNYAECRERIREDLARGSGLLVVTAHLGSWELLGSICSTIAPAHVVAERPHAPALADWLEAARGRLGMRTLYTDVFPRELIRALARNELVGILADHDLHRARGLFAPFLGREAWTPTAPVVIAQRTGCVLRPVFLVREGEGERYRFVLHDAIRVPPRSAGAAGIREATLCWVQAIEREIRARPEQWTWMHPRWRTRPPGEALRPGERSPLGAPAERSAAAEVEALGRAAS